MVAPAALLPNRNHPLTYIHSPWGYNGDVNGRVVEQKAPSTAAFGLSTLPGGVE
jgi:hypothetical protein